MGCNIVHTGEETNVVDAVLAKLAGDNHRGDWYVEITDEAGDLKLGWVTSFMPARGDAGSVVVLAEARYEDPETKYPIPTGRTTPIATDTIAELQVP